jgi:hypothetical protein
MGSNIYRLPGDDYRLVDELLTLDSSKRLVYALPKLRTPPKLTLS